MRACFISAVLAVSLGLSGQVLAQMGGHGSHAMHSPYAGQQSRDIASLSVEDVSQILDGKGWGLAKPAELNGYPGPKHILELSGQLKLTPDQRKQIEDVFDHMQAQARKLGTEYIAAERALDHLFRSANADKAALARQVVLTGKLLSSLRLAHLSAHLDSMPVLSLEQRQMYAQLRGYGAYNKN